jgi:AAHS family 4-hydroxybenzoate transporter-like MFS transporter
MSAVEQPIDVGRLIDERPMSRLQVTVAVLCAVCMFFDGYDIQVMALAVPSLTMEWGVPPSDFGLALSAVMIGLVLGTALLAPLGDRLGRRTILIAAMTLVGIATACTSLSNTPGQFVLWRLLTGIGLGISFPNCNAWTAEYAPVGRRAKVVVMMNCAVGLGAFSAGLIAPSVLERWGWHGTFLIGSAGPLLVALLMFSIAPESLKFLVARRPRDPRIPSILRRIAPDVDPAHLHIAPTGSLARGSLIELLSAEYRSRTVMLWLIVLFNLITLHMLINWLPTLLQSAGLPLNAALRGAVLIQAGGVVGGILLSVYFDRGQTLPALLTAFLIAAICLALFLVLPRGPFWMALLLLIGLGISGAQLALNALATAYYPPPIKATGMSWAGAIGGIGSIVAPLIGAWAIARGVAATNILAMLAVPALLCAACIPLMRREWQAH